MSQLAEFSKYYDFPLDEYQRLACEALTAGSGVLVAAPTGAGKTVVGEFAAWLAISQGRKLFYTTPIKALSNQKYHDLVQRFGPERVGLLTGDSVVNAEAQLVVMTTEVLRNMMYAGSPTLHNLGFVVMDEVHYLADRFRGAVWEEAILGLAEDVRIVALSATVSNVEDFGEWLRTVRGDCQVVVSETRPVPLYQHVLAGRKLFDLFAGTAPTASLSPSDRAARVNKELLKLSSQEARQVRDDSRRPRGRSGRGRKDRLPGSGNFGGSAHPRFATKRSSRGEMAAVLAQRGLLPAICFVFSRVGCEAAVGQLLRSGVRLTNREESQYLGSLADRHVATLERTDLEALKYEDFREALCAGIAAHHAGLLPAFKAIVEEGFASGSLKLVFATETLALGINMPAKTVVIEKLVKYNGETHADITPGEYTQLTGRAGRRGIDVEGHAVVLWQPGMDPRAVAGLASRRTYPLRSSFAPTYNMAVNLLATVGQERARGVLSESFAQFQIDKQVVAVSRATRARAKELEKARAGVRCKQGDFLEYARLREQISQLEGAGSSRRRAERAEAVGQSLQQLRPGDLVHLPKPGWCVVLRTGVKPTRPPAPWIQVITLDHSVLKIKTTDLKAPLISAARIRVPRRFSLKERSDRRALIRAASEKLETVELPETPQAESNQAEIRNQIAEIREQLAAHPCHDCPDREAHALNAVAVLRLEREDWQSHDQANSLATRFDRVCAVLTELGYLEEAELTEPGRMLRRIYNELDLVAAESIRQGVFAGLDAPQLAAVLSTLVYESRPSREAVRPKMPDAASEAAQSQVREAWRQVGLLERRHKLERTRDPDIGFAEAAWRWASGQELAKVLLLSGLPAGDFVRWVRQVVDLAGQLAQAVGPGDLRRTCLAVVTSMRRGIVDVDLAED